jgi:hypothetical protein
VLHFLDVGFRQMLAFLDVPFPGFPVINAAVDVTAFFCALAYYRRATGPKQLLLSECRKLRRRGSKPNIQRRLPPYERLTELFDSVPQSKLFHNGNCPAKTDFLYPLEMNSGGKIARTTVVEVFLIWSLPNL